MYNSLPDERPELKHMDFKSKRCYYEKRIAASIGILFFVISLLRQFHEEAG